MPRYRIVYHQEELDCPQCGEPLYIGESAYQDGADGDCYCSAACCIKHGVIEHQRKQERAERARAESEISGS